jgi:acetylglutamate kinase
MEDIAVLKQSLPYIRAYRGKTFVVKFGGEVVKENGNFDNLAADLSLLHELGIRIVIIHGGGPQLSDLSTRMGVKPVKIDGKRVTDDETLSLAKMAFSSISIDIMSVLRKNKTPAVGLSGVDGDLILARKRPAKRMKDPVTGAEQDVDFQNVGDVVDVNPRILDVLLDNRFVPVVASLAADENGRVLNINADTIASEIAVKLRAEKLFGLSDVNGILRDVRDPESRISYLTISAARQLAQQGVIKGGMIPKLESAIKAVQGGVGRAHILNGFVKDALVREVFTRSGFGTMIIRDEEERIYLGEG